MNHHSTKRHLPKGGREGKEGERRERKRGWKRERDEEEKKERKKREGGEKLLPTTRSPFFTPIFLMAAANRATCCRSSPKVTFTISSLPSPEKRTGQLRHRPCRKGPESARTGEKDLYMGQCRTRPRVAPLQRKATPGASQTPTTGGIPKRRC